MAEPQRSFRVVSPDLVPPDLKVIEARFTAFTLRMRQQMATRPVTSLPVRQERHVKSLAKQCHARRLRQAGLRTVPDKELPALSRLASEGGRLIGPATLHEVDELAARLHDESPWMAEITTFLMQHMRGFVRAGGVGLHLPPIILVGPPGVGKSWYARGIASAAGVPDRQIDVGAGTAAFRIAGTEKGWSSVQSGLPVEMILQRRVANPLMVVDEIDKAGTIYSSNGNSSCLTTALLGLLDPGTAPRFECPALRIAFDMSRVIWVLTANHGHLIPPPLRDRCRVFHMPEMTEEMALVFFDRLTRDICGEDGMKAKVRAFVAEQVATGSISLRQIARLVETLRGGDDQEPVH